MFSRLGPAAYRPSLNNTLALCEAFDNPQHRFKSIHVAGTNGKGSVSHMLAAILQKAGYKTGLYTSPHLRDFRERIRIDGNMIPESAVIELTEKVKSGVDQLDPSFFEVTVLMAFEWFARSSVDIAVIETGLGGRLDSTNVIVPELSIITNVGMDHMDLLGNSLSSIASEKAGIIKKNVPVVIGEFQEDIHEIFDETARRCDAVLTYASRERSVIDWEWKDKKLAVEMAGPGTAHSHYQLDLTGIYQLKNLVTVLEACARLNATGWNLDHRAIHEGLSNAKRITGLHGRWEQVREHPALVLEVAHNLDGIQQVLQQLEVTEFRNLHIVTGFVKDKELGPMLELLPRGASYYFTQSQIPRALPAFELAEKAGQAGLQGKVFDEVNAAVKAALEAAGPDDLVLVCGSIFLVGEVRPG